MVQVILANGTSIVAGKNPSWLVECAIRPRGGEALIYGNYIEGYRFGIGVDLMQMLLLLVHILHHISQVMIVLLRYGANHTGFDGDKGCWMMFYMG